jgi:hypothetical protein
LVVVFCLACGTVVDTALGRYQGKQQGESSLLRTLEQGLESGDVLLADRCYSGWFDLAWWQQRGVDVVTRLHARRRCDLRRGRRLGAGDHCLGYAKPPRPEWMDEAAYRALPAALDVREVRVTVEHRGFRTKVVVVVTTLLDARAYAAQDLAAVYRLRWQAEIDQAGCRSSGSLYLGGVAA